MPKPNENQVAQAQAMLTQYIRENGMTATDVASRRLIYSIYSAMTGDGSPAAEYEQALDEAKTAKKAEASKSEPVEQQYTVGPKTMEQVFEAAELTNVSDLQAVLDSVEAALASKPDEEDDATPEDASFEDGAKEDDEEDVLHDHSVEELREMASDLEISGRSSMNKAELVAAIKEA